MAHLDPDELAALEEQRDFLLASLRDLEAEHAAGDLDDADHAALRDDYTARAAAVLHAIEEHRSARSEATAARSPLRTIAWAVGVVVFAVLAGVLVAQSSGRRGEGDSITGDIRLTNRQRLAECQQALGAMDLDEAVDCFDEVIDADPSSAEALAYRGWATALSSFGGGEPDQAALDEALEWLDRALGADDAYPDALAFRIVVLQRAGREDELADAFAAFDAVDAPQQMRDLVDGLRGGPASPALVCRNRIDTGAILDALRCFEDVLADDPTDVEALAWKGWTLALTGFGAEGQDEPDLAAELWGDALALEDQALAIDGDLPEAWAFRAIVLDALGRQDEADAALVELFAREPEPALVDGVEQYVPDARARAESATP